MRTLRYMVAMMAIVICTSALNVVNAQNTRQQSSASRTEANHHRDGGQRGVEKRGGERRNHDGHMNQGGHHNNGHMNQGGHHNNGHLNHGGGHHYDGHMNHHGGHNGYHSPAHHYHNHCYRRYDRPVCHYYHNRPVYVHHEYYYTRPVHVHHMCRSYVPVVGHVVDCLPDNYVELTIDGCNVFRALGYIFRPVTLNGVLRFVVE